VNATAFGWFADEDSGNIDRVGHRRWGLNPTMDSTGFGHAGSSLVMFAFGRSAAAPSYEAIGFPSGPAFPRQLFLYNYPWSITVNPNLYATPVASEITVTLTGGGKSWTFNQSSSSFSGNYFNVDTGGYGVSNCIIFRPRTSDISAYNGTYTVTVTGLKLKSGSPAYLSYNVTFYDINGSGPSDTPDPPDPSGFRLNATTLGFVNYDFVDEVEQHLPRELLGTHVLCHRLGKQPDAGFGAAGLGSLFFKDAELFANFLYESRTKSEKGIYLYATRGHTEDPGGFPVKRSKTNEARYV